MGKFPSLTSFEPITLFLGLFFNGNVFWADSSLFEGSQVSEGLVFSSDTALLGSVLGIRPSLYCPCIISELDSIPVFSVYTSKVTCKNTEKESTCRYTKPRKWRLERTRVWTQTVPLFNSLHLAADNQTWGIRQPLPTSTFLSIWNAYQNTCCPTGNKLWIIGKCRG